MSGGTTLDSWRIECEDCNISRGLQGVTASNEEGSFLGGNLNREKSKRYTCEGERPWCGDESEPCEAAPVAILRNSISVYMAKKISALAIPGDYSENVDFVVSKIQSPSKYLLRTNLNLIEDIKRKVSFIRENLRVDLKEDITDQEIEEAIMYLDVSEERFSTEEEIEKPGQWIKEKEFEKLSSKVDSKMLKVEPEWIYGENKEENYYTPYFQRFSRVLRLKETTALYGFDRKDYKKTNDNDFANYYPALYKNFEEVKETWLPVNEVFGEGIFIQLNLKQIEMWESCPNLQKYFDKYLERIQNVENLEEEILKPRNIMLHTLSHFLIDEFANVSGYNRAAIRERLYLSDEQAGVLIYISAGDSDGTLGGLVRLGLKRQFFTLLDRAINNSEWCSSDPVCTEIGESQGPGISG
uniref:Uncharacterized protein n=1 Tax=Batrachochytrium dendrobatidis (strain JAM81 / FGSC 10211) TaxID=684364 RepID=F4PFF0_BATDJ|eukprot:XP_006683333.1 hypothetical protein BATDEDRAFT_93098 [Batrachochytrium dendrobatidis JAM81]